MGCLPSKVAEPDMREVISSPVKVIVVLLMENRSFDHILGWQKRLNPEIDGVTGKEWNALSVKDEAKSQRVYFSDDAEYVSGDPGHSFQAIRQQIFGSEDTSANPAPMNGFAEEAETISKGFSKTVMSGFKPEALPIHTALVKEFAVFDKWFAAVPSSTQPNRQYVHSATSHGLMSNVTSELVEGLPQRTIFDNIYDAGLSFGIYFQSLPSTLLYRRLRQLKYIDKFHAYDLAFKQHAKEGKLPNYVVVEPRYFNHELPPGNDDHPPHDVANGQALIKEVYETLRASPQWNETLLIITYDEHGGFYDHVPTPVRNVPNPDGVIGPEPYYFKFDRLGVRVPCIMVSPWIEKGQVIHSPSGPTPDSQFEHSSIPATVRKLLNLPSDFLTKRDAWAGTFETIISSRSAPRKDCPEVLPSAPKTSSTPGEKGAGGKLSEFQEELVLLAKVMSGESKSGSSSADAAMRGVEEAAKYVKRAIGQYMEVYEMAKKEGASPSSIVCREHSESGKPIYRVEEL